MALPSTIFRIEIDVSDVDRGTFLTEELRLAQHPSESTGYFLSRIFAWALEYDESLEIGRGIAHPDEPTLFVRDEMGNIARWIEVGAPTADRMHKITKQAADVRVYTHRDIQTVLRELRSRPIHRAEDVKVFEFPQNVLKDVEERLERRATWSLLRSDGVLYVTIGDDTFSGPLVEHRIVDET